MALNAVNKGGRFKIAVLFLGVVGSIVFLVGNILFHEDETSDSRNAVSMQLSSGLRKDGSPPSEQEIRKDVLIAKMKKEISDYRLREEQPVTSAWENVPDELDHLFEFERIDVESSRALQEKVERFLDDAKLEGTVEVDARCGGTMCRVRFEHDSVEDYKDYQHANLIHIWFDEPNYYSGAPNSDGTWSSSFWMGTGGHDLPVKEIYDRQKRLTE